MTDEADPSTGEHAGAQSSVETAGDTTLEAAFEAPPEPFTELEALPEWYAELSGAYEPESTADAAPDATPEAPDGSGDATGPVPVWEPETAPQPQLERGEEPEPERPDDAEDESGPAPETGLQPGSASDSEPGPDSEPGSTAQITGPSAASTAGTRRSLLLAAMGGLLVAGLVTALPSYGEHIDELFNRLGVATNSVRMAKPSDKITTRGGAKSVAAIEQAVRGDCLMWPEDKLNEATVVPCVEEHKFEVADQVDMRMFPGAEYGPDAEPPSAARIEQITQEQCESSVSHYLGPKFDPHSKFVASMLWSGSQAWREYGERRMLCGLQLPGHNDHPLAFTGHVADIDQSKVWPAGTCLGIDTATGQPTDVPVDCAAPHAKEVTGTVNLAERFPEGLPPEPEQDGFIKDTCTKLTESYLEPVQLRDTTLTLTYATISLPSWAAGSREVACSIGATLGGGGWATLVNSAKGPLLINGQPPVPPPEIPAERRSMLPELSGS